MTTDMTLGQVAALRRQEAEARAQARSGSTASPESRPRRRWSSATPLVTTEDANAAFARRKAQADAIHERLDRRIYLLERMLLRLTHPIRIPEGAFEIEDRPLTDWPSTPPEAPARP